ncbi:MAG: DUF502 domain-containing protein [Gammaproteobacteria bacterium]|nr:DUF502 domain-containing protein [Gammaproteobacteria bacterium]
MKLLWRTFLRGLATVLPIAVTISILSWIGVSLESVLGGIVKWFVPDEYYLPGTGLLVALVAIFLLGATVHAWFIRKLIGIGEDLIERIPLAKTIYGGVRDLMKFVSATAERDDLDQVVAVDVAEDIQLIGFITGHNVKLLEDGGEGSDLTSVYLPMSYQLGGYTICVPSDRLTPLEVPVEDAMRWVLTAGVTSDDD